MDTGSEKGRGDADWIFQRSGMESTQLMNLLNIPMLHSQCVKKLTGVTETKANSRGAATASLKSRIKAEFQAKFLQTGSFAPAQGSASRSEQDGAEGPDDDSKKVGKQKLRQNQFHGYGEQERADYSVELIATDEKEARPITALDDILLALRFAVSHIEKCKSAAAAAGDTQNKNKPNEPESPVPGPVSFNS